MSQKTPYEVLIAKHDALTTQLDKLIETIDQRVQVKSKRLKDALGEQIELQMEWENMIARANHLLESCEIVMESVYAKVVSDEMSQRQRKVSITEAKEYAKANMDYKNIRFLMIDIRETRDVIRGILETIVSRKYVLNNITNAVVSSNENHLI